MKRKRKKKVIKNKKKRQERKWRKKVSRGEDISKTIINLLICAVNTSDVKYYDKAVDALEDNAITKENLKGIVTSFACRIIERKEWVK